MKLLCKSFHLIELVYTRSIKDFCYRSVLSYTVATCHIWQFKLKFQFIEFQ